MTASALTKAIIEYCNKSGHYVYRANNVPTKQRVNTLTKGVADILGCTGRKLWFKGILYESGTALAIEVKIGRDKQSLTQKDFESHYRKRGGIYIIAHKLEDVTGVI